jgi:hypothetical protein
VAANNESANGARVAQLDKREGGKQMSSDNLADDKDPKWLVIKAIRELHLFVDICYRGMHAAANATSRMHVIRDATKLLNDPDSFDSDEQFKKALSDAERLERFAKSELALGFPYLFSTATVRLWSIMENWADSLVVLALQDRPASRLLPQIKSLKGNLIDFVNSTEEDRMELLVEALKAEIKALHKIGVGRFETMFDAIGLGGPVDSSVRKVLLELAETRHVIVHRGGIIDQKLVGACPWLHSVNGERLCLTLTDFEAFGSACLWYVLDVYRRWIELCGRRKKEGATELMDNLAKKCERPSS